MLLKLIEKSNNALKIEQSRKFIVENGGKEDIVYDGRYVKIPTQKPLNPKLFIPINKYFSNVEKYNVDNSELLIIKAIIAAKRRTIPLAASSLKNDVKPFVIF